MECVHPDEDLFSIIALMGKRQIRRIPVVDREDQLIGIISLGDIAQRADYDEEVQGALERANEALDSAMDTAEQAAQALLEQAMAMVDNATTLVEDGVNNALSAANNAIDQAQDLLRNAATDALEQARAATLDRARDALGPVSGRRRHNSTSDKQLLYVPS